MNSSNQYLRRFVQLKDDEYTSNSCLTYGIWSKYNPLSTITQIGRFGLFDSLCFHLHNAIDQESQSLNLVYYDCLNSATKKITKTLLFINNLEEQNRFEITIDPLDYENTWFYLQIISWPLQDMFRLIIMKRQEIQYEAIRQMKYPFKDTNLIFSFGGNLLVHNSKIYDQSIGQTFSYFPGPIILQDVSISSLALDYAFIDSANKSCVCSSNSKSLIGDMDVKLQDINQFISEKINCDSFVLVGWIKVKEIVNLQDQLTYQLIKIQANLLHPTFQNQNLSPFQIIYHISSQKNELEITTYSYTFPDVSIDFSNNPFLLSKRILIENKITMWHYLKVELQKNKLSVAIIFYEEKDTFRYDANFQVLQFQNCQFKVQYGNCLQTKINYLNILIRNLEFYNCYKKLTQQSCHYSCLECDGPTNQDCLSCSVDSQRIYLPKYKVCICPQNTIDNQNQCQSYQKSGLRLIKNEEQNTSQNCKYGYFEFEGDCIKCPSLIKEQFISCVECLNNPKSWFDYPICQIVYVIKPNITFDEAYISFGQINYYFDGILLNPIHDTHTSAYDTDLQNIDGIFKEFQLAQNNFRRFCQQMDFAATDQFICYECFIDSCQVCQITPTTFECVVCYSKYVLVDGECIQQSQNNSISDLVCLPPFYYSFEKQCKICEIKNCIYCFEYSTSDLNVCTLVTVSDFNLRNLKNIKIGCALCEENYIFDFTLGLCLRQIPEIDNCQRTYINLQSQELCVSSKNTDFSIAPEISNCQKYIENCNLCSLNIEKQIKCVVCQDSYVIEGNKCYQNEEFNIQKNQIQNYTNKIQSFILQFVPNLKTSVYSKYLSSLNSVQQYCDSQCLLCDITIPYCKYCPLNYQKKNIITEKGPNCTYCHPLCEVCQARSAKEIQLNFPNFNVTQDNQIYTKKCIKAYWDPTIFYDHYSQIVKYCFNQDCKDKFIFDVSYYSCDFTRFNRFYESAINTQYCNQIGMEYIKINFTFQVLQPKCFLILPLDFSTQLKQKVFTVKKVDFKLSSQNYLQITLFTNNSFKNYDQVEISNLGFLITADQFFLFQNTNNKIDLILSNFTITQSVIQNIESLFRADVFGNIIINNFTVENTTFINSSIFNFELYQVQGKISITNLKINNCTIIESALFKMSKIESIISLNYFILDQSLLKNSSIFSFFSSYSQQSRYLNVFNTIIRNSNFSRSYLINCTNQIKVSMNDFQFYFNSLEDSVIISVSHNISINNIKIYQNVLSLSQFISITQILLKYQIMCKINDFIANNNHYQSSNIILIFSTFSTNLLIINFDNFEITENFKSSKQNENIQLFCMNSQEIRMSNFLIIDNHDLVIFYLSENTKISITNMTYKNSIHNFKIPISSGCLITNNTNKLLYIFGFTTIYIANVQILHILSVDEPIIQINPSQQNISYVTRQIQIINVTFTQNILIQSTLTNLISLLIIESDKKESILLQNIEYEENFFHSYTSTALREAASLLYISSSLSLLKVMNFFCKNNAFTNSSNAFIAMMSAEIILINYTITNHNFLSQQIWTKYYELQFNENLNQQNLNEIIFQILQIKNIGGAGQFSVKNMSCIDCAFSKILAMQSSVFDITTNERGLINLFNITIDQIENNLLSIEKGSGCISIYSSNSDLNLNLVNAVFSSIFNRMAPSIFTINPSKSLNIIQLKNTQIINCISLLNQIINVQFSSSQAKENIITVVNMRIAQRYDAWSIYFLKIRDLLIQEVTDTVNNQNSMISFQNCIIYIQEFFIEGIITNSIFQFTNTHKLELLNVKIDNIQMLYSFNLIQVTQTQQIQSIIQIEHLVVKNAFLYKNDMKSFLNYLYHIYNIRECNLIQQDPDSNEKDYFYVNVNSLQQNNQLESSLLYFKSISNQNCYYFKDITFQHNDCKQCDNGLLFIEISDFKYIKFENFNCIYNSIKQFGCLHFSQQTYLKSKISITNSNFLFNNGSQGVGVTAQKTNLTIKKCKILNNNAETFGGGLYMQVQSSGFNINQSIIIGNKARIGGGIYLDDDCNLNNNNFLESFLLFNAAEVYGNNLKEIPNHLAFFVNYVESPSESVFLNNEKINKLDLKTHRMVEQGIEIFTKDLLIPSNQVIQTYQIFDIHNSKYKPYIKDISLYFQNSRNEKMHNLANSSCEVKDKIIAKDQQELIDKSNYQILVFDNENNSFPFGSLSFSLDPYQQNYSHLQIEISCQLQESSKILTYLLYVKSLKCQLGEFYVDNGCQLCQSNQGYYSVIYNATKCSIFDKEKYSDITSNMIQLLPGFWRPSNFSDYVEPCFKNPIFCLGGWQVSHNSCNLGHIGALCEECDIYNIRGHGSYFKNQWDDNCLKCQFQWSNTLPILIGCLWTFISISMSLRSISRSNQLYASLIIAQRFSKILFKLNQDQESIQLKMMINYIWIFSVIFTFNIRFQFSLLFVEQTSDTSYFIAKDFDCQISSIEHIPLVYLKIFAMLIFMITLFILTIAGSILYSLTIKQKLDLSLLSNTALYLYVFNYAGLIKMFSSLISKREVSNNYYIQGDLSLKYGSQDHYLWMYYFIIPGLFVIGALIPILIFILLKINRTRLEKIKLRRHISYLLNEYKQERYYWELIKLFKKSIIIFIMTNFETDIVLKASLLGLCLLVYQILATFHQPFTIKKYNSLDLQTSQICSISIFLAITKYICEQNNYVSPSIMLQIFIIGCVIKLCYPFVFWNCKKLFQKVLILLFEQISFSSKLESTKFLYYSNVNEKIRKRKIKEKEIKESYLQIEEPFNLLLKNITKKLKTNNVRFLLKFIKFKDKQCKIKQNRN
ncbi:unnamed protein product (macronuclear) [Paramecium tetraurelia]|uniref:Transmembrane protein n=1 Tax=Paramecium tetraurelia TaxID=5888 RepID=A0CZ71_PARTE|nr:uncharacterized protein GSPATT00011661001 [Paramecium tetraurelia]CAK76088.1 unnamed protein product [Paramecium tetraurelia]|eukprot:XP_001443485.1 hypothetical protein (macronuclear) [Paramecium tetraurelia strain d4-2]